MEDKECPNLEERPLTCIWCNQEKKDVRLRIDPYSYEISNDETLYPICDDCTYDRAMDI